MDDVLIYQELEMNQEGRARIRRWVLGEKENIDQEQKF